MAKGGWNMHDLVVRGGKVYDGTGAAPIDADVAIDGDRITAIGQISDSGKREINAAGKIVTPGFVDIHTHYDGQVTWDPYISPSTYHGVTTIVTGNCGVGFAPCKPDQRDWLIGLMEGVEDIPGTALHEGLEWQWESFPEYLDALDKTPLAIDVGTQIPHGAVRAFVMGERGVQHEAATPDEIEEMAKLVAEAIHAGALGFSTSRTEKHKDSSGELTPSITALEDELVGIAKAVGDTGTGVLQGISDFYNFENEFKMFHRMAEASGRPVSITVEQQDARPEWWQQLLDALEHAQADGLPMYGQVPPRATGVLLGLTASLNPLMIYPAFRDIQKLPLEEKVAIMRDPEFKAKLLSQPPIEFPVPLVMEILTSFNKMFRLGEPANYEPDPSDSFKSLAERENRQVIDYIYDMLLEKDGKALIYHPLFNYMPGNLDFVEKMLKHPYTIFGLSDGGAHCGALCDASFPTTLIQHWGRDRTRGNKMPLEQLIHMQTQQTASQVGMLDRGVLKPGYKADVNIIDFEALTIHEPTVVNDLPAGGRRLIQKATGYEHTIVSGQIAFEQGEPTGVLAGQLVRGTQNAP
jgi:N-acyl-D-aspartate/D-glutamate deacylase